MPTTPIPPAMRERCSCGHPAGWHAAAGRADCVRADCQCALFEAAAERVDDRWPSSRLAHSEARRLVLLVELEQLSRHDLVELSDFLHGLLSDRERRDADTPGGEPFADAVSVRAAYAFGDWPPRLEAVPR